MNDMSRAAVRVACDVGGTFTDVCVLDQATGQMRVAKTPTTPDPIDGVLNGIKAGGVDLRDMVLFAHGTTLATNALITRNFPPAIMVTTKGFRDVIEIRRGTRDDLWDTYKEMAPPYIQRRNRLVVTERIDYSGTVIEPVNEAEAREAARIINKRGVKTIAVCFANAFANPENERRMRDILEEEVPGTSISLSSEIMPEIFEHERFSTTVANAVLAPVAGDYVTRLATRLREGGYDEDILLLHSGGGVMTEKTAAKFAARLAASGIAAGAIASRFVAQLAGYENSISLDMGGTSTDVSLCDRGNLRVTTDWYVQYGYPICFPSIEVLTIGAGGGSLAWIDAAKSLRNGPQSAGSAPGPACYGKGGVEPTNSDANIVLGRISDRLAGGAFVTLDRSLAEDGLGVFGRIGGESIHRPLGLGAAIRHPDIIQLWRPFVATSPACSRHWLSCGPSSAGGGCRERSPPAPSRSPERHRRWRARDVSPRPRRHASNSRQLWALSRAWKPTSSLRPSGVAPMRTRMPDAIGPHVDVASGRQVAPAPALVLGLPLRLQAADHLRRQARGVAEQRRLRHGRQNRIQRPRRMRAPPTLPRRAPHRHRTNGLARRPVAMTCTRRRRPSLQMFMRRQHGGNLRGQRIGRHPWMVQRDNTIFRHGVSLLAWRPGGSSPPTTVTHSRP